MLATELAGGAALLGPAAARFSRHELSAQYHWPLLHELRGAPATFSVLARAGALVAPRDARNRLAPSDRFYLGGPTSFAGFAQRGVAGSSTRRAQLGGHAFWTVQVRGSCGGGRVCTNAGAYARCANESGHAGVAAADVFRNSQARC